MNRSEDAGPNVRIVLVDDHSGLRSELKALLESEQGLEVVAEARNGVEAVLIAGTLEPDVVVMDVAMPGLDGVRATRRITSSAPGVRVLGFSIHSHSRLVEEMLEAGASGYLLKDDALEHLREAIHVIARGETYLGPGVG